MILNQTAEYALRAMTRLALLDKGRFMNATDLAQATGIPRHYLSKIMNRLARADIVDARKGHRGGFRLARLAKKISFADILQAFGFGSHEEHCLFGWPNCDLVHPCPLHDCWSEISVAFDEWAESTTLAHTAPDRARMVNL